MSRTLLDLYKIASDDNNNGYSGVEGAAGLGALGGAGYAGYKANKTNKSIGRVSKKIKDYKERNANLDKAMQELDARAEKLRPEANRKLGFWEKGLDYITGGKKSKRIKSARGALKNTMKERQSAFRSANLRSPRIEKNEAMLKKLQKGRNTRMGLAGLGTAAAAGLLYDASSKRNRNN